MDIRCAMPQDAIDRAFRRYMAADLISGAVKS